VFVPDANKLAKADDFEKGLNANLMQSRLTITWIFAGAMAGAFEAAYTYAMNRQQFGKPIAGFQLTQEKLVRMQGEIQSCISLLLRVTQQFEAGKATMGQIAMTKAHVTRIGRDVTRVAREIQGANGILWENQALKQMMDMEGSYTGEGTYDINCLIAGRELTGLAAFK
jgi:acyl-CoA oxidase